MSRLATAISRAPAVPRPRAGTLLATRRARRLLLALIAVPLLAIPGWMWLRDSALVGVTHVKITGLSGAGSTEIRDALENAAQDMTTLHVRVAALKTAVANYPVVADVQATGHPLHSLTIHVVMHTPVAALVASGRHVAIAADGTILSGVLAGSDLPVIPVDVPPGGARLTDPHALRAVQLLAAAPEAIRARITRVQDTHRGLTAILRNGPRLIFGAPASLVEKWAAAARVLADPSSRGAAYLDLRTPGRVFAGGLVDPATQAADAQDGPQGGTTDPGTTAAPTTTTQPAPSSGQGATTTPATSPTTTQTAPQTTTQTPPSATSGGAPTSAQPTPSPAAQGGAATGGASPGTG